MKNHLLLSLILLAALIAGCQQTEVKSKRDQISADTAIATSLKDKADTGGSVNSDTLRISHAGNKYLGEILRILPDSAFGPGSESDKLRNFILSNKSVMDPDSLIQIKKIKPNTIAVQVVDALWTMSIYKVSTGNHIVITLMGVGDGRYLNAFEHKSGKLRAIKFVSLFGDFAKKLLPDKDPVQCGKWLEENLFGFDYDFDNESIVRIYSLFLKKVRSKPCLKGNTLHFAFNKQSKRFDLSRTSWQTSSN